MFELLTGTGLAIAAGLNAYVPLLVLGLASRFLDAVQLPVGWTWLENEWVLGILGVLLILEIVADKIPAVDTVNDWVQTIVRPTAGGIVFGSGAASQTALVSDPAAFFTTDAWIPVAIGVGLALIVHLGKMTARPIANAATAGVAAPVLSTIEDVASVTIAVLAIVVPILIVLVIAALIFGFVILRRRRARQRAERAAAAAASDPSI